MFEGNRYRNGFLYCHVSHCELTLFCIITLCVLAEEPIQNWGGAIFNSWDNFVWRKLHFYGVTWASPTPPLGCLCLCICNMYVLDTYIFPQPLLSFAYVYTSCVLVY